MLTVCSWLPAMLSKEEDTAPALARFDVCHVIRFTRTSASTQEHAQKTNHSASEIYTVMLLCVYKIHLFAQY